MKEESRGRDTEGRGSQREEVEGGRRKENPEGGGGMGREVGGVMDTDGF